MPPMNEYALSLAQGFKTARYAPTVNQWSDARLAEISLPRRITSRQARDAGLV